ncbi:hypothetical protein GGR27_003603 [Lewinella antarctica]|uniref:Uncharacterized protein n=1 Tax=Neolewinella antarctica TaxID=442734 RepID=A0ABX0XGQ0_9BACT|nr:hypothetical protein [Neolewinella antarctica]
MNTMGQEISGGFKFTTVASVFMNLGSSVAKQ